MTSGDGVFAYRHGVAAAQIAVFSIFLLVAGHFKQSNRSGWLVISNFSIFRIVGASCLIALINDRSDGLWVVVFVCESQGVLLVLFLLVEILQRINEPIRGIHPWTFHAPTLIAAVELAVSVGGFVTMAQRHNVLAPTPYSIGAAALVALNHICVIGIAVAIWRFREQIPTVYLRGLSCVWACALPLTLRIVYTLIYVCTGDKMWNNIKGNATIYLFLSAIPEIIVVAICSWTILKLPPKPDDNDGKGTDEEQANSSQYSLLVSGYGERDSGGSRLSNQDGLKGGT